MPNTLSKHDPTVLELVPPQTQEKELHYGTEELLDGLPRRWTRSMLHFLVGFTVITLPWAMFSKVDETGSARGRLEPKDAIRRLDAAVAGTVIAVGAKEGETVKTGQLLVEIESDVLQTELQQAQNKLEGQLNRLTQLELVKNQMMLAVQVQEQQNQAQALAKIAQVNQAKQNLNAKLQNYNLQKWEKLAQLEQAKQNIKSSQTARKIASSRLNRDLKEVQRYRQLSRQGAIPEIKVVELEKTAEESQRLHLKTNSEIKQAKLRLQAEVSRYQAIMSQRKSDIEQAKLALDEQKNTYKSVVNAGKIALLNSQNQLKDIQTQLATLKSEIAQSKSQITSLKIQLNQRIVRAPVNGTIFELPFSQPGSVVQPGQIIAKIAPKTDSLILKAEMASQNSGFLEVGMPVKIKFDAYPFQEYGVMTGRVSWISPDSKIQQTNQGKLETFDLEISLPQSYIQAGNKHINLTPGQTATAEVIIHQRRVIDFILDPFKKLQKGGLKM
ncbi:MAG: HlyD family efflux transporter periplasmic adaptor subunit [Nostocaceae cyanobacterium]|nr:HlyD family efflux transporter periplasmic adaptor subunit [Nostocaceae cyanobacterium]